MGNWQIGPNFLWQKPVVGPMPHSDQLVGRPPADPATAMDDPFAVRYNRHTTAGEIMLTYDPTPATWMWSWDSDIREDARLAASLSFIFKRHHTTADAGLFISAEDQVSRLRRRHAGPGPVGGQTAGSSTASAHGARMISHLWFGTAEPNGDNERLINRFGVDSRIAWPVIALAGHVKVNDYGPYDYHGTTT